MKIKPVHNRVHAKKLKVDIIKDGIYIPETVKQSLEQYEIVSIGSHAQKKYPELRPGQIVLADYYSHTKEEIEGIYTLDADAISMIIGGAE
jgi:co-chaperonin GroES (HSP10)